MSRFLNRILGLKVHQQNLVREHLCWDVLNVLISFLWSMHKCQIVKFFKFSTSTLGNVPYTHVATCRANMATYGHIKCYCTPACLGADLLPWPYQTLIYMYNVPQLPGALECIVCTCACSHTNHVVSEIIISGLLTYMYMHVPQVYPLNIGS